MSLPTDDSKKEKVESGSITVNFEGQKIGIDQLLKLSPGAERFATETEYNARPARTHRDRTGLNEVVAKIPHRKISQEEYEALRQRAKKVREEKTEIYKVKGLEDELGLRAIKELEPEDPIEYGGELLFFYTEEQAKKYLQETADKFLYPIYTNEKPFFKIFISANKSRSLAAYANHAWQVQSLNYFQVLDAEGNILTLQDKAKTIAVANLEARIIFVEGDWKPKCILYAKTKIPQGYSLQWDYGSDYWNALGVVPQPLIKQGHTLKPSYRYEVQPPKEITLQFVLLEFNSIIQYIFLWEDLKNAIAKHGYFTHWLPEVEAWVVVNKEDLDGTFAQSPGSSEYLLFRDKFSVFKDVGLVEKFDEYTNVKGWKCIKDGHIRLANKQLDIAKIQAIAEYFIRLLPQSSDPKELVQHNKNGILIKRPCLFITWIKQAEAQQTIVNAAATEQKGLPPYSQLSSLTDTLNPKAQSGKTSKDASPPVADPVNGAVPAALPVLEQAARAVPS